MESGTPATLQYQPSGEAAIEPATYSSKLQQARQRSKSRTRSIGRPLSSILHDSKEADSTSKEPAAEPRNSFVERVRRRSRSLSRHFSRPTSGIFSTRETDGIDGEVPAMPAGTPPVQNHNIRRRSRSRSLSRVVSWSQKMIGNEAEVNRRRAALASRSSSRPQSMDLLPSYTATPIEAVPLVNIEGYRHSIIGLQLPSLDLDGADKAAKEEETQAENAAVCQPEAESLTALPTPDTAHSPTEAHSSPSRPAPGQIQAEVVGSDTDTAVTSDDTNIIALTEETSPPEKQQRRMSDIDTLPSQLRAYALAESTRRAQPSADNSHKVHTTESLHSEIPIEATVTPTQQLEKAQETAEITSSVRDVQASPASTVNMIARGHLMDPQTAPGSEPVEPEIHVDEDAAASTDLELEQPHAENTQVQPALETSNRADSSTPETQALSISRQPATTVELISERGRPTVDLRPATTACDPLKALRRKPSGQTNIVSKNVPPMPLRLPSHSGVETPLEDKIDRLFATSTFAVGLDNFEQYRSQSDPSVHPALRGMPAEQRPVPKQPSVIARPMQDSPRESSQQVPSTTRITDQFALGDVANTTFADDATMDHAADERTHKRRSSVWENIRRSRTSSQTLSKFETNKTTDNLEFAYQSRLRRDSQLDATRVQRKPSTKLEASTTKKRFSAFGSLFGRSQTEHKSSKVGKLAKKQQPPSPTKNSQPTIPHLQGKAPDYAGYEASRRRQSALLARSDRHEDQQDKSDVRSPGPVVFEPGHAWYSHFANSTHHYPERVASLGGSPNRQGQYRPSDNPDGLSYHKVRGHGLQTDLKHGPADLLAHERAGYGTAAPSNLTHGSSSTGQPTHSQTRLPPNGQQYDMAIAQPAYAQPRLIARRAPARTHSEMAPVLADNHVGSAPPPHVDHAGASFDFGFDHYAPPVRSAYSRQNSGSPHMRGVSYPGQEWIPAQA